MRVVGSPTSTSTPRTSSPVELPSRGLIDFALWRFQDGRGRRCAARRCGRRAGDRASRFCFDHEQAVLELYGLRDERVDATDFLETQGRFARRLRAWAASLPTEGGISMVAYGYEPPAREMAGGIVQ